MSTPQAAKALAFTIGAKVTIDRVPQAAHKNIAERHRKLAPGLAIPAIPATVQEVPNPLRDQ